MAAIRTYGIPGVINAREIFFFNNGQGKLPIMFANGITDPKYNIPATYSTANPFEQMVIEHSSQFGVRVFRYGAKGEKLAAEPVDEIAKRIQANSGKKAPAKPEKTKTASIAEDHIYPQVENIGQATEVLLDLGCKADELTDQTAVMMAAMRLQISFPNLSFK